MRGCPHFCPYCTRFGEQASLPRTDSSDFELDIVRLSYKNDLANHHQRNGSAPICRSKFAMPHAMAGPVSPSNRRDPRRIVIVGEKIADRAAPSADRVRPMPPSRRDTNRHCCSLTQLGAAQGFCYATY